MLCTRSIVQVALRDKGAALLCTRDKAQIARWGSSALLCARHKAQIARWGCAM